LLVKGTQQFTANVQGTGSFNSAVTWHVSDVQGGNSTVGTITSSGFYTAPNNVPNPNGATVKAQSVQDTSKLGTSTITINPESVQLSISPASASLQLGGSQKFNVTVTGTVNQSFFWTINGAPINAATPWGTLDSTGLYTAPALLPANPSITITATSLEDTTKSVSAVATILATAGGITVTITPQNPQVVFDGSQSIQFNATVSGTNNAAVNWSVDNGNGYNPGNITSTGVFTPLTFDCSNVVPSATVHAVSAANPGAQGTTTVNLVPAVPVITSVSPQPASVESAIQVSGTFAPGAALNLLFPGPNGVTIVNSAAQNTGTTATGSVPLGASSGSFSIQQVCSSPNGVQYPPSQSNAVPFARLPQLRIRTDRKDLAVSESVQLHAAFLGDPAPRTVNWGNGISSAGIYTAPAQDAPDTFVKLSGCVASSTACDSLMVRVNPVRIDPEVPSVPTNQTLQLSALSGGASITPTWRILAGGGTLSSNGLYTPPTVLEDTGPVLVTASYGGSTVQASVGVTGAVPGLVNRILDYPDPANTIGGGTGARSLAVDNSRAYVLSESTLSTTQEYCWIDAYDTTDPVHPVWLDAAEALKSEIFPYKCSGKLFAYGGFLYEVIPDAGTSAGVSSEILQFQLLNNHLTIRQLWSVPLIGGYYAFDPAILFNQGVFYALSDNLVPLPTPGTIPVVVLDVRTGNLVQSLVSLPLPQPSAPASYHIPVPVGNFMYAFVDQTGTAVNPQYKLATYDISVNPPQLLGLEDTMVGANPSQGPANPKFFGNYLSDGWDVYDISTGIPHRVGTLPFTLDDINTNRSLALAGNFVIDVSDPTASKARSFLLDGVNVGFPFTWVGDFAYRMEAQGGLGIYSPLPKGGQIPLDPPPSLGGVGTIFDQSVSGSLLYVAQQGDFTGVVIDDLSTSPPALVGNYSEPGQDPFSLALVKNYLFVGTAESLLLLDVSTPSAPSKVATLALPTSTMAIFGNSLFAGTTDNRLVVLDISNPAAPLQIAQVSLPDFPNIVRAAGNLLFIADNTAGLLIYNISNPSHPVPVSQYQPSSATEDVAIDGNLALLAAADGGLIIADITNPAAPSLVGQVRVDSLGCFIDCLNPAALSVTIHGGLAYVGSVGVGYGEVFGFDYRTPAHPRLVSLMSYGGALDEVVLNFAFYQSEMFAGGSLFAVADRRADISQPRNVINLYYPSFAGGSGLFAASASAKRPAFLPAKLKQLKKRF
jgi:hypothetical protein